MRKFAKYIEKVSKDVKEGKIVTKDEISAIYDTVRFIEGKLAWVCNFSTPYVTNIISGIAAKVGKLPIFLGVRKELPT